MVFHVQYNAEDFYFSLVFGPECYLARVHG
jgi:hypothetical protein